MTRVVNAKNEKADRMVCRGTLFGNPYEIGIDGDRRTVIKRYRKWFYFLLKSSLFVTEVEKLKDKTLGCFCKPDDCHADVIAEYLNSLSVNSPK